MSGEGGEKERKEIRRLFDKAFEFFLFSYLLSLWTRVWLLSQQYKAIIAVWLWVGIHGCGTILWACVVLFNFHFFAGSICRVWMYACIYEMWFHLICMLRFTLRTCFPLNSSNISIHVLVTEWYTVQEQILFEDEWIACCFFYSFQN